MNQEEQGRPQSESFPVSERIRHIAVSKKKTSRQRKRTARQRSETQNALNGLLTHFPHLKGGPLPRPEKVHGLIDAKFSEDIWKLCGFDTVSAPRINPVKSGDRAKVKEQLAAHYLASLERLASEQRAYVAFFNECLRANTRLRLSAEALVDFRLRLFGVSHLETEHSKLIERHRAEKSLSLPSPRNRLEIEHLSGDLIESWAWLRNVLWQSVTQFIDCLRQELQRLSNNFTLGAVEWVRDDPPGCKATYFSQLILWRLTEIRPGHRVATTGVFRCEAVHTVSLLNAYSRPAAIKQGLFETKRPERIERVFRLIPPSLRARLNVVYGTRAKALTVEREVEQLGVIAKQVPGPQVFDSTQLRFDPLLTWGDLVLCGWDDDEWKKEKSDKEFLNLPYLIR